MNGKHFVKETREKRKKESASSNQPYKAGHLPARNQRGQGKPNHRFAIVKGSRCITVVLV